MNILIVTHYKPNYFELSKLTDASKRKYASKHGYDFHPVIGDYYGWGFDFQRIKIVYDMLFTQILGKKYDYVWWTGCDTMVINYTKKLESIIEKYGGDFIISKDINGLNNDSVLYKNTEWTKKWLEFIMSKEPDYRHDCWESQRVMQHFAETDDWKSGVSIIPPNEFNSYFYSEYKWPDTTPGDVRKGDLLLHLPGMDLKQRLDIFNSERVKNLIVE